MWTRLSCESGGQTSDFFLLLPSLDPGVLRIDFGFFVRPCRGVSGSSELDDDSTSRLRFLFALHSDELALDERDLDPGPGFSLFVSASRGEIFFAASSAATGIVLSELGRVRREYRPREREPLLDG